jgi:hypothetical protein
MLVMSQRTQERHARELDGDEEKRDDSVKTQCNGATPHIAPALSILKTYMTLSSDSWPSSNHDFHLPLPEPSVMALI